MKEIPDSFVGYSMLFWLLFGASLYPLASAFWPFIIPQVAALIATILIWLSTAVSGALAKDSSGLRRILLLLWPAVPLLLCVRFAFSTDRGSSSGSFDNTWPGNLMMAAILFFLIAGGPLAIRFVGPTPRT